jgi:hypothetical protein
MSYSKAKSTNNGYMVKHEIKKQLNTQKLHEGILSQRIYEGNVHEDKLILKLIS